MSDEKAPPKNLRCIYCGGPLQRKDGTYEDLVSHVISRPNSDGSFQVVQSVTAHRTCDEDPNNRLDWGKP